MRTLPLADPGTPPLRSPGAFLRWVAREQVGSLVLASFFGVVWMCSQAVVPAVLGRAIDEGVAGGDTGALLRWCGLLLAIGALQAGAGVARHRVTVWNWLTAMFRVQQLLARRVVGAGAGLSSTTNTGEVVAVSATDAMHLGAAMDIVARASGAFASFVLVAMLLLRTSVTLGLVVLLGVPLLTLGVSPLLRPLHERQTAQRAEVGRLTTLGSDTVAGLRVLRGMGGEAEFATRYAETSQRVRRAGVSVARVQSVLDAGQVLLPGIFVVVLTWLGARLAISGRISPGELVAFYGFAAFLLTPLHTATEAVDKVTKGLVSAERATRVLAARPALDDPRDPMPPPARGGDLVDPMTGLVARAGQLTAVVCALPEEASALADRLGGYVASSAALGGVPLQRLAVDDVRHRVLVADKDPHLFTGRLREELDPTGRADDDTLRRAVEVASASDVVEALPGGLDGHVEERGRSFSGGQRQRFVLARALLAEAEVLVLDEPTSAVDAHTEARIAERLAAARADRTTVVMTTSPLVLDHADRVLLLVDGEVVADGRHPDLLRDDPRYRYAVTREEEDA